MAAAYHAAVVIRLVPASDQTSDARHGVFVGLGLIGAAAFHFRPRWFALFFALFAVQQVVGHSQRAWQWWAEHRSVDWLSLVVLLTVPLAAALLVNDAVTRNDLTK